jgi:hypothetical protein
MVFIGFESGTKGYRFYDPLAKKLHISRDVIFEENRAWKWSREASAEPSVSVFEVEYFTIAGQGTITDNGGSGSESEDADAGMHSPGQWSVGTGIGGTPAQVTPPGSPAGQGAEFATPPTGGSVDSEGVLMRYRTLDNINDTTEEITDFEYSGMCCLEEEPSGVEDALSEQCWREAMAAEMEAIQTNKTWELAELPAGHRAIGLNWVFKVKKDPEGNVVKYKARLVAKGYAQREGVDYKEVFAPVARIETVRLLLALAARSGWKVHHTDVKSAFLNGDLCEEVYVQQPLGFVVENGSGKVLRLRKALYGLRQAPRAWNARLDKELLGMQDLSRSY